MKDIEELKIEANKLGYSLIKKKKYLNLKVVYVVVIEEVYGL